MNASDYGGGTPIVDIWRRQIGIGVGHLELAPKLVSLPVARTGGEATLAMRLNQRMTLSTLARASTRFAAFVAVHHGDYFQRCSDYRRLMVRQGVSLPTSPPSAFEPIWCAWGYGREFDRRADRSDTADREEARLRLGDAR